MPAWKERIEPGEAEAFEALAKRLAALQADYGAKRPIGRALHYKPVLAAIGALSVAADLPEPLRVGVFAAPGTLPAIVRFSNGTGTHAPDDKPDVRGLAVKLVGVPGEKLVPALRDAETQDFLAIHTEVSPFTDAHEFVTTVEAGRGPVALAPFKLVAAFGPIRTFRLLQRIQRTLGVKLAHYAERPFYSALPIAWGEEAVKYAFFPVSVPDTGPIDRSGRDHYAPDLAARLRMGPLRFELRVQRFVDEATTPIEDPSVAWPSPWTPVATLELPAQDVSTDAAKARAAWIEGLSFDPWHAPLAFRPLGALMRARNVAYRDSVLARKASPEPTPADLARFA